VRARLQAALVATATAGVLYLVAASVLDEIAAQRAQERAQHATVEKEATERAAKSLAEQVIEACQAPPVDPRLAPACEQAQKVKRTPPPRPQPGAEGPRGPEGPQGEKGEPGGTCPDGQQRRPYTYPDERDGSRCVLPPQPADDETGEDGESG
jgi:hypothetical protein